MRWQSWTRCSGDGHPDQRPGCPSGHGAREVAAALSPTPHVDSRPGPGSPAQAGADRVIRHVQPGQATHLGPADHGTDDPALPVSRCSNGQGPAAEQRCKGGAKDRGPCTPEVSWAKARAQATAHKLLVAQRGESLTATARADPAPLRRRHARHCQDHPRQASAAGKRLAAHPVVQLGGGGHAAPPFGAAWPMREGAILAAPQMGDPRASFAAGSASTEPMSAPGDSVGGVHKRIVLQSDESAAVDGSER